MAKMVNEVLGKAKGEDKVNEMLTGKGAFSKSAFGDLVNALANDTTFKIKTYDKNGNGTPVSGNIPSKPPKLITIWANNIVPNPRHIYLPDIIVARLANNIILVINIIYNMITIAPNINPFSSVIIENIISVWGSGIYEYFWVLLPLPTPLNPPKFIAI